MHREKTRAEQWCGMSGIGRLHSVWSVEHTMILPHLASPHLTSPHLTVCLTSQFASHQVVLSRQGVQCVGADARVGDTPAFDCNRHRVQTHQIQTQ